jgi:hypothetical protein
MHLKNAMEAAFLAVLCDQPAGKQASCRAVIR